jgi:hypothetical protein
MLGMPIKPDRCILVSILVGCGLPADGAEYGVVPQRAQRNVQVQRPGLQIQVQEGMPWLCWQFLFACQPIIPVAYAQKVPGPQPVSPSQQIQVSQQGQPVRLVSESPPPAGKTFLLVHPSWSVH